MGCWVQDEVMHPACPFYFHKLLYIHSFIIHFVKKVLKYVLIAIIGIFAFFLLNIGIMSLGNTFHMSIEVMAIALTTLKFICYGLITMFAFYVMNDLQKTVPIKKKPIKK
jgi:hypothetical protein